MRAVQNFPQIDYDMSFAMFTEPDGKTFAYATPGAGFNNKLFK